MSEENFDTTESKAGEQNENNPQKRKWRKKRKNFLSNAKKYAKKGQMGRGTQISEELYQYFVGILEAIKQGIEDKDEKQALVNNVLERTKGEELNIIGNQLGCRVIELLIPYSTPEDLERYIEVVNTDLRRLCSDNFCGYVLNSMLTVCSHRATDHLQNNNQETEDEVPKKKRKKEQDCKYSEEHVKNCHEFVIKISKYVLNNLEDFVWEPNTNYMVRTVLKCLSGINLLPGEKPKVNLFKEPILQNKGIPPHQSDVKYRNVPEDFTEIVKEFGNRLSLWPQFKDLPFENMTSALLQVLLFAVKNADKTVTKHLIKKLLNESFAPDDWVSEGADDKKDDEKDSKDDDKNEVNGDNTLSSNLPPVFQSEAAVRLLEAALFVAKKKLYTQIYAKCFINRLGQLATVKTLNFTVQRLIDNCQIKEEFEPMFDELCPKFEEIMSCGNTGVLVALAKACHRLKSKQTQFVQHLEAVLKCTEDGAQKYFSVLCLRLQPLDKVDVNKLSEEYFIHIHGSIILQTILDFQRPTKAISSVLSLSGEELLVVLSDAKGCHVADALCTGQFVGVKSRDKLVKKLKGYYQKLALSQHGSRAFEQIFEASSPEQQVAIMTELSDKSNLLNGSQYGRIIATKYDLNTFKLSQKAWEKARKKAKKNQD
ncbi:nucleolar protein 9 [Papilio machaon]|uniref:nucleolar protein 9 n=1 Tax=Papilio machaon TaxID=76193 RepID=UPI001E6649A7|nr:nucleolar protein 9 [Papilio machaon]